jgi:hypothetical protein
MPLKGTSAKTADCSGRQKFIPAESTLSGSGKQKVLLPTADYVRPSSPEWSCPIKTPSNFRLYGIREFEPSKKLWRAPESYCGPFKKEFLSSWWGLEQSGALSQIGDPGAVVNRVRQKEIAAILNVARETVTKRLAMFSSFGQGCRLCTKEGKHALPCSCKCHNVHPEWRDDSLCKCHGRPRRQCHSEKLSAIAANHPHWNKGLSSGDDRLHRSSTEHVSPVAGDYENSTSVPAGVPDPISPPGETAVEGEGDNCRRANRDGVRARKHVGAILARNPGFAIAQSYALACKDGDRPGIGAGAGQVAFLARTFGDHLFSRKKQEWLDPRQSLEGFRKSYGWMWHPNMPTDRDCACVRGQLKLGFQEVCPKCAGAGYIITSPFFGEDQPGMTDYAKMQLHWLLDRGIDKELRRCGKCEKTFEGDQLCPGCHGRGDLFKKRGELNGPGSAKYTEKNIADALGLNVSTVRRNFTTYKRLNIIRTKPGEVWRKCQKCTNLPLYTGACPGCGSTSEPIKRRDAQLIIWLPSRTLDKQIAEAERVRLKALVKWHESWLDQKHQADLVAAVELAKKVLGEWEGKEHLLLSFYNEMRRRLAASKLRANLVNVLFPLQRE